MDWELSKENFAPVRQGRAKAALAEVVEAAAASDSSAKAALEAKRRRVHPHLHRMRELAELWRDVREYNGDDPIEPWMRLVKWTQEHLVGGSKAELQKTIESCTQKLLKLNKYNSDVRYLRLWIQYADCLPDPSDVFLFLREKQIGHEYALFYEAHATYNELKGNCTVADQIYSEGIARCAKPLERLKQKYEAFQKRMAARIQRKMQEEETLGTAGNGDAGSSRVALSSLSRAGAAGRQQPRGGAPSLLGTSMPRGIGGAAAAFGFGLGGGGGGGSSMGAGGLPSLLPQRPQAPLPVTVDDEFGGARPAPSLAGLPSLIGLPQGTGTKDLKPYHVMRKENETAAGVWTAASAPQRSMLAPPAPSSSLFGGMPGSAVPASAPAGLEICVDDEFLDEEPQEPAGGSAAAPLDAFRALAAPPSSATTPATHPPVTSLAAVPSLLGSMPAACHGGALQTQSQAQQKTPQQQQQQQCGSSSAARGSGEGEPSTRPSASGALGYDEALLTGGDGCEQQFEEARAAAWVRAMQANRGTTEPGPEPIHNAGAVCAVPTGRAKPHSPTAAPVPAAAACAAALPRAGEGAATMQARPLPLAPLIPAAGNSGAGATSGASELLPLPGRALPHATRGTAQQQQQQQQRAPAHGQQAGQQQSSGAGAACTMATSGASRPSSSSSWPDSQSSAPPFAAPAPTPAGHAPVLPSAPPAGHSGHYAEPTVTLSTRAAFDVLNDMFNDAPAPRGGSNAMPPPPPSSQQQQQQQPPTTSDTTADIMARFGRGVAESSRAPGVSTAAAASAAPARDETSGLGDVTLSTRAAFDALNDMFSDAPAPPRGDVTLSTRAAFDALNDMFCDSLPHEGALSARHGSTGCVLASSQGGGTKPLRASDVCRLANGGKLGGRPAAVAPTVAPSAPSAFLIHEDTDFAVPGCSMPAGPCSGDFMVFEDTQFLPGLETQASQLPGLPSQLAGASRPPFGAPSQAGLSQMMPTQLSQLPGLPSQLHGHASAVAVAPQQRGTGLQIHEDTEFITRDIMRQFN